MSGPTSDMTAFAIAAMAPELNFIAQDLETVVAGAKHRARAEEKESERVGSQAHDFLTPQLVKNAEVYLLRFICHDYSDKCAAKIMENIIPAMGEKSRLVVMEGVMSPPGQLSKHEERLMR